MRKARWAVVLGAIAALGTAAVSCSSDDGGGGDETGAGGGTTVTMADLAFDPTTLTVTAGEDTAIALVNEDSVDHSFTLDDDSASQEVAGGESGSVTINVSTSIGWHCEFHPGMTGTVEIA